jgi:hypothetical protein
LSEVTIDVVLELGKSLATAVERASTGGGGATKLVDAFGLGRAARIAAAAAAASATASAIATAASAAAASGATPARSHAAGAGGKSRGKSRTPARGAGGGSLAAATPGKEAAASSTIASSGASSAAGAAASAGGAKTPSSGKTPKTPASLAGPSTPAAAGAGPAPAPASFTPEEFMEESAAGVLRGLLASGPVYLRVTDTVEWDLADQNSSPETYIHCLVAELGLAPFAVPPLLFNLREALINAAREGPVLARPDDQPPTALRSAAAADRFTPRLELISTEERDRLEIARQRETRAKRRNKGDIITVETKPHGNRKFGSATKIPSTPASGKRKRG